MKFTSAVLLCIAVASMSVEGPNWGTGCGTEDLRPSEMNDVEIAIADAPVTAFGEIQVPTVFHIITSKSGDGSLPKSTSIQEQLDQLNTAYGNAGIKFVNVGINQVTNDKWFTGIGKKSFFGYNSAEWSEAGKELRQGGSETLNVYIAKMDSGLLGVATWPADYKENNKGADGVRIDFNTLPGGAYVKYNNGNVLSHEVGHWLGLYHTFQGGCAFGDEVSDTPAVAQPNRGCPAEGTIDSCPNSPGTDDVKNIMDYVDAYCMERFTPLQIERMQKTWETYRA